MQDKDTWVKGYSKCMWVGLNRGIGATVAFVEGWAVSRYTYCTQENISYDRTVEPIQYSCIQTSNVPNNASSGDNESSLEMGRKGLDFVRAMLRM